MSIDKLYLPVEDVLVRTTLLPTTGQEKTILDLESTAATAIAIASPSLFERMGSARGSNEDTERSVRKYRKRMSHRPTPYGMFAGVSLGHFGQTTDLKRADNLPSTFTRPDMSWLIAKVEELEGTRTLRPALTWVPNPELIFRNSRIWSERLIDVKSTKARKANIKAIPSVLRILQLSTNSISIAELSNKLIAEFGVNGDRADKLIHDLCDMGILISTLRFGLSEWYRLRDRLGEISSALNNDLEKRPFTILDSALRAVELWDKCSTKSPTEYLSLLDKVKSAAKPGTKDLVQVDTAFALDGTSISQQVADEAAIAAELVLKLSTDEQWSTPITVYRDRFVDRYQEGREVPLLEVLSTKFGLGSPYAHVQAVRQDHPVRNARLLELLTESIRQKSSTIQLSDDDLAKLMTWNPAIGDAPVSLDLFFGIEASTRKAIDAGNFRLIVSPRIGELGAGRATGRFAHMLGPKIDASLKAIVSAEQTASESLAADVSYWTLGERLTNVAIAPSIRPYCITANCANLTSATSIPVSEILIGVSENRLYARWSKTGQKISAHSSNMLNAYGMPESIRFLLDIAAYGYRPLRPFDWGWMSAMTFLPRVSYGRIVVHKARWNLSSLAHAAKNSSPSQLKTKLDFFITDLNVPSQVEFADRADDDNTVLLNLDDDKDLDLLASMLKKTSSFNAVLNEHIASDNWHETKLGTYATEFVGSFVRRDLILQPPVSPIKEGSIAKSVVTQSDYLRLLGSDWMYLKLVAPAESHEEIIVRLKTLSSRLLSQGLVKHWFFVRYAESQEDQLRLRFNVDAKSLYCPVLPDLLGWATELVNEGLARKFSIETYDREVERYGGVFSISLFEQIFAIDSVFVADVLELPPSESGDKAIVAIMAINAILDAFGLSNIQKWELLKPAVNWVEKKQLSNQYRASKKLLDSLLSSNKRDRPSAYSKLCHRVDLYKENLFPVSHSLLECEAQGLLCSPVREICQSLIHMHCNRLLGLDRFAENNIRALLAKALDSSIKRPR